MVNYYDRILHILSKIAILVSAEVEPPLVVVYLKRDSLETWGDTFDIF